VQQLAGELDRHGELGIRARLQGMLRADDAQMPGHRRSQGALRQNRMAWLILSAWLVEAKYLTLSEAERLNAAHLEARAQLAQLATDRQRDNKPSTIFLTVLRELLQSGELLIEQPEMACPRCGHELLFTNQAWFCTGKLGAAEIPCSYSIPAEKIIGFDAGDGTVGLFAEQAFRHVSRVRKDQNQMFAFSSKAIWQMLDADGLLAARGKDGYPTKKRNPARLKNGYPMPMNALVLRAETLRLDDSEDDQDQAGENIGTTEQAGTNPGLAHQDAIERENVDRIKPEQNGRASDQGQGGQGVLFRLDPVCSDRSEQEIMPSPRHELDFVPIDPTFSHDPSMHESTDFPPLPSALAPYLNESLWRVAVRAHLAGDVMRVNRIAQGRSLPYDLLVSRITQALDP
jgi:hypothetical protein